MAIVLPRFADLAAISAIMLAFFAIDFAFFRIDSFRFHISGSTGHTGRYNHSKSLLNGMEPSVLS